MNKIRKQIEYNIADIFDYPDFRCDVAVDLLEETFKRNTLSFSNFLRENYEMSGGTFRETGTKNYDKLEEIYKKWSDEE